LTKNERNTMKNTKILILCAIPLTYLILSCITYGYVMSDEMKKIDKHDPFCERFASCAKDEATFSGFFWPIYWPGHWARQYFDSKIL
jgi:hypothetical protein